MIISVIWLDGNVWHLLFVDREVKTYLLVSTLEPVCGTQIIDPVKQKAPQHSVQ